MQQCRVHTNKERQKMLHKQNIYDIFNVSHTEYQDNTSEMSKFDHKLPRSNTFLSRMRCHSSHNSMGQSKMIAWIHTSHYRRSFPDNTAKKMSKILEHRN